MAGVRWVWLKRGGSTAGEGRGWWRGDLGAPIRLGRAPSPVHHLPGGRRSLRHPQVHRPSRSPPSRSPHCAQGLTSQRLRAGRPVRDVPRRAGGQPGTAADFRSRPTKEPLRARYSGNCGLRCGPARERHERRSKPAGAGPGACEKGPSTPIPRLNVGDRGLRRHDVPPVVTADSTGNGGICQLDRGNISLRLSGDRRASNR